MFPAALPAIFTGLRISAGLSVIGAIVGDFFFGQGDTGIGQELRKYANNLDGEELFTAVIMASLLGVVIFLAVNFARAPRHRALARVPARSADSTPISSTGRNDEPHHHHTAPGRPRRRRARRRRVRRRRRR